MWARCYLNLSQTHTHTHEYSVVNPISSNPVVHHTFPHENCCLPGNSKPKTIEKVNPTKIVVKYIEYFSSLWALLYSIYPIFRATAKVIGCLPEAIDACHSAPWPLALNLLEEMAAQELQATLVSPLSR